MWRTLSLAVLLLCGNPVTAGEAPLSTSEISHVGMRIYSQFKYRTTVVAMLAARCQLRDGSWLNSLLHGLNKERMARVREFRSTSKDRDAFDVYAMQLFEWEYEALDVNHIYTSPALCDRISRSEDLDIADGAQRRVR